MQNLLQSLLAIRYMRQSSLLWTLLYFITGLLVFSCFAYVATENQDTIKQALLDYLFPSSWHRVSEKLGAYLFEAQAKVVISNAIIAGSLVLASVLLFPLKEQVSASFERDAGLARPQHDEFPLWLQALEESKLFLFYLTGQSVILWLGYYPYVLTKTLAIVLSFAFLFFTFGLDFIAPSLQRHRFRYNVIVKSLFKRFVLVSAFGACFTLPLVLLAKYLFSAHADLSVIEVSSLLFLCNMVFLTLAIPAGTRLAHLFMPSVKATKRPSPFSRRLAYSMMFILLLVTGTLHIQLVKSLHHKSQLLKANYDVDFSNAHFDWKALLQGGLSKSKLAFDLVIENPTEFDIAVEDSVLYFDKDGKRFTTIQVAGFAVEAGDTKRVRLKLSADTMLDNLDGWELKTLLNNWEIEWHIDLWPGLPFIIKLTDH